MPAAATSTARSAVLALARGGEHRRFLDAAHRLLPIVGADVELVAAMVQSFVALGLGGPARELTRLPWLRDRVDPTDLQRSLARIPIGRVPRAAQADVFEANLALRPEVEARRSELMQALDGFDTFRTTDGDLLLSRRLEDGMRHWVGGFSSTAAVEQLELVLTSEGPVPAIIGLGLNRLVERVHAATAPDRFGKTVPLYLVEDRLAHAAAWLHAADRSSLLRDERVLLFLGDDAARQVEACLDEQSDLPPPELYFKAADETDLGDRLNAAIQRSAQAKMPPFRAALAAIAERAESRSTLDWAQRLQPGATVMAFTSRFTTMVQHTIRDLGAALESLGYRFVVSIERAPHVRTTLLTNAEAVLEHDPALVVLVNHFRREQPETLAGVPVVSWIQDPADTVFSRETGASLGPHDFVCGYYMRECVTDFGYPQQRFVGWPIPVSTRLFHDEPLEPAEAARMACDAMYVGHRPQSPAVLRRQFDEQADPMLQPVLDRLEAAAAEQLAARTFHAPHATRLVGQVAHEHGFELDAAAVRSLGFFLTRVYDAQYRAQTLRWVAAWARSTGRTFHLYGSGWEQDPDLASFARGPIAHGPDLRAAYRGARLVIQAMPTGFQHQRTFEAYSSGSFVLARRALADLVGPTLEDFNTNVRLGIARFGTRVRFRGFESIMFDDANSFAERAEHFLEDDDDCGSVRTRFGAIVSREYTYDGLVPPLIDWIRTGLRAGEGEA